MDIAELLESSVYLADGCYELSCAKTICAQAAIGAGRVRVRQE